MGFAVRPLPIVGRKLQVLIRNGVPRAASEAVRRVGRILAYASYPNWSLWMSKTDQGRRRQRGDAAAGARQPKPPFKEQHQRRPGLESKLDPQPAFRGEAYRSAGCLAQPGEIASAYAFLASNADSPYITGTVLQVMGGETTGG
jgi:NAD(P)-dependent dehydrogenase (short-subunit alcohol dehydrogenase family)